VECLEHRVGAFAAGAGEVETGGRPAFSQAVVVENPAKTIYIGGQNGVDADGKVVGPTVGEQSLQALRNLETILKSEGATLANVVHWTVATAVV
jgi:enamine deaminase RidA (YjgF/YER057c/UK114 family)